MNSDSLVICFFTRWPSVETKFSYDACVLTEGAFGNKYYLIGVLWCVAVQSHTQKGLMYCSLWDIVSITLIKIVYSVCQISLFVDLNLTGKPLFTCHITSWPPSALVVGNFFPSLFTIIHYCSEKIFFKPSWNKKKILSFIIYIY